MKRATLTCRSMQVILSDFNPRPREEGDTQYRQCHYGFSYFNPRPREEGDIINFFVECVLCDFNPRPREEGDARLDVQVRHGRISIHALVKRATRTACPYKSYLDYFNPRPREEGDVGVQATAAHSVTFQSTPS